MKRTIALITAGAAGVAGAAVIGGAAVTGNLAAAADRSGPERHAHGRVAGAEYEIEIEKERGFEVDAELDGVAPRSTWRMVVRHDGKRVGSRTAHAVRDDGRHEVDFRDLHSADTRGADRFVVVLKRVDGPGKVTRTLRFAR